MAKYPALPLFTDSFIADTTHLNAMQTGAYLMLLMCAWRTDDCMLPDDDKVLARYARMDGRAWAANKDLIMGFWRKENGKWYQRRLRDERKYVEDVSRKNAEAGKNSALKRKERHSTERQPNFNETSTPTPTPTPTSISLTNVSSPPKPKKAADYSESFEAFWKTYPANGASKKEAFKSYAKTQESPQTIHEGAQAYAEHIRRTASPVAHATTWLNNERWSVAYGELNRGHSGPHSDSAGSLFAGKPTQRGIDPASNARIGGEAIVARRTAQALAASDSAERGTTEQLNVFDSPSLCLPENIRGQGRGD